MALRARRAVARDVIPGNARHLCDEVFFTVAGVLGEQALSHQQAVGGNAQAGVVMESSPATSFVMVQATVLLQILVVTLDAPAPMGGANQLVEWRVLGHQHDVPTVRRRRHLCLVSYL